MIYLRNFTSSEPSKIINIISILNDSTRLEILALLMKNVEGLTAADISRQINKKIPSTLYQLEIIQASGLIKSEMKLVHSIGREIKHWILPEENYYFTFNIDINVLIVENQMPFEIRDFYLTKLLSQKRIVNLLDINKFDRNILQLIVRLDGSKLTDKDIDRMDQMNAENILIDTFIHRIRSIIENMNINESISIQMVREMFSISDDLTAKILNEINKYYDIGFNPHTQTIFRKN